MFYLTGTNASYGSVTISNGAAATLSATVRSGVLYGGSVLSGQIDYMV